MQQVDLNKPIASIHSGSPPVVINVAVQNRNSISEGVPSGRPTTAQYVLLAAMPDELQRRIVLAVQAIVAGM